MILAVHYVPAVDAKRFVYLGATMTASCGIAVGFSCFVRQEGATVPKDAGFTALDCARLGVMPRDVIARFMNHNKTASTIAIHGAERFRKMLRAALDEFGRPDEFPRPMQRVIDTAEISRHLCRLAPDDDTSDSYRIPTLAEATAAVLGNACTGPAAVQALANHLIKMNMTEAA